MSLPHIEIKTRYLDSGDARSLIEKGTIIGLVTEDTLRASSRIFSSTGTSLSIAEVN